MELAPDNWTFIGWGCGTGNSKTDSG